MTPSSSIFTPEDQYFEKIYGLKTNPFRYVSAEDIELSQVLDLGSTYAEDNDALIKRNVELVDLKLCVE